MTWHHHPDASRIARDHWRSAQAFIVAQNQPCIEIREDELANIGDNRVLLGGMPEDLDAWQRPDSWFIAVVICAGDDTRAITRYVRNNRLEPARVHFYLHQDASFKALAAWRDAGLPTDRVDDRTRRGAPITDWASLHQLMGLHLNVQVVEDFLSRDQT